MNDERTRRGWREALRHAFAVNPPHEFSAEDRELVDRLARVIVARRMEFPATLWLEAHRPLAWSAAQVLHMATPLLSAIGWGADAERLAGILDKPGAVEFLQSRLDELAANGEAARPDQTDMESAAGE